MLIRGKYLKRIRPYYDSDFIKVLTGIRRCGKSTILAQIMDELSSNISKDRLLYIDLESYDYASLLDSPSDFYNLIKEYCKDKEKVYLFIDEIQYLKEFERVIASIRSSLGCSVFVTGSTSSLLAGELASRLTGRVLEFRIMPFSYSEVFEYTGKKGDEALIDYLYYGGMPVRFNENSQDSLMILSMLYKSILKRDIISAKSISNQHQFTNIASFVLANSGQMISGNSISGYLSAKDERIASSTVYQYLRYLEESYLINCSKRFSIKGKQILETLGKYYAADPAFITMQNSNQKDMNKGLNLETVVYLELLSRGYTVYTGKTYKGEIDFVVMDNNHQAYIQVAYLLSDDEIIKREFSAFSSIHDNYPKYVISMDKLDFSRDGIIHLNIESFLLNEELFRF